MESTKETIIRQSLNLFSDRGYEGVSMRDIAFAVGIKAASLYNHFASKEDIFNCIIEEMSHRYEQMAAAMQVPQGDMDTVVDEFMQVTEDNLLSIAGSIFLYFLKDDFAAKFRRMLTMEQFRSLLAGDVFQNFFIDSALTFQESLFGGMIARGGFIPCDPYVMALQFYSPIFLLLCKYDRKPECEAEALGVLEKHVRQFSAVFTKPA